MIERYDPESLKGDTVEMSPPEIPRSDSMAVGKTLSCLNKSSPDVPNTNTTFVRFIGVQFKIEVDDFRTGFPSHVVNYCSF